MRFLKLLLAVALLSGTGLAAAAQAAVDNKITKLWRKYPSEVTAQEGPVPGLVVLTSQLTTHNDSSMNGNSGAHMGQCTTLVHESVLQRDLRKEPLRKDEILGFSCTTAE